MKVRRASLALLLLLALFCAAWGGAGHVAQHEPLLARESCSLCSSVQSLLPPPALGVAIAPLVGLARPVSAPALLALGPDRGSPRSRAPPPLSFRGA